VSLTAPAPRTFMSGIVVEKTPTGERPMPRARVVGLHVGGYGGTHVTTDDAGRFESLSKVPNMVVYARGDGPLAGFTSVPEDADEVKVVVSPAATVKGRVVDTEGKPQARIWVHVQLDFGPLGSQSAHYRLRALTDNEGRFTFAGYPVGTEGEVAALHMKDGRPTGARTVVSFQVPILEPVELTDLIVPPSEPAK
jgi:hypothetical protein